MIVDRSTACRIVVLMLAVLLAAGASGQDYERGADAWRRGEYAAAIDLWQPLAQAGHARAQFAIGLAFDQGRGVSRNAAEAARWYRRAAADGLADAQYNLGNLYATGRGVPRDAARAVTLFRAAAEQRHTPAQVNLAYSYEAGKGVDEDLPLAAAWYARAAMAGNREASERFYELRERGVRPAALPGLAPGAAPIDRSAEADSPERDSAAGGEKEPPLAAAPEAGEPETVPGAAPREAAGPAAIDGARIRLAAYRSQGNAERGWQLMRTRHGAALEGVGPLFEPVDLGPGRGRFLRLEAGPFPSRAAAVAACAAITAAGDDCVVLGASG